jgi:FtsZ-binding cell division protein ZapB
MDDGFELLEEKVRKAAETVKRLREENEALEREKKDLRRRLEEAAKGAPARAVAPADARRLEALAQEVKQLQHERDEIKKRIASLLDVLEGLESL